MKVQKKTKNKFLLRSALLAGFFAAGALQTNAWGMGSAPPSQVPGLPMVRARKHAEGIYRGARPGVDGVIALQKFGIRTIINLENDEKEAAREKAQAESLGIGTVAYPMSALKTPDDANVDRVLAAINNPDLQPVYVHCKVGKDRTGLIMGLDRVLNEGWTPDAAYKEMKAVGFNPIYRPLREYFEKRVSEP